MAINHQFHLGKVNKDGLSSITYRFNLKGKRFLFGTGKIIMPQLWDNLTQSPTKDKKLISKFLKDDPKIKTEFDNTSKRLENIISLVTKFFSLKEEQNEKVNFEDLKVYLNKHFNYKETEKAKETSSKETKETIPLLSEVIERFYNGMIKGNKTIQLPKNKRGQRYSVETIQSYHSLKVNYEDFIMSQNRNYLITDISLEFENSLLQFLNEEKVFSPNYQGTLIKILKVIVHDFIESERKKLYDNQKKGIKGILDLNDLYHIEREIKRILKPNCEAVKIYLNDSEIEKLFNLDLSKTPTYDKARDIFLTGCYTALRHSDYKRLSIEHVKSEWIDIIMKKGGNNKKVFIPIRPELMAILKKWNNKIPEMSSQKLGKYIKEIGKLAEINEFIEIIERKGNENKTSVKPKYELITTHTARRSAATNMYNSGMNPKDIMSITGHSKIETFEKYIIKDDKAKEIRLSGAGFFKGNINLRVV